MKGLTIAGLVLIALAPGHLNAKTTKPKVKAPESDIRINELNQSETADLLAKLQTKPVMERAGNRNPETWLYYGTDRDGVPHFWEKNTLLADSGSGSLWEKWDPPSDKALEVRIRRTIYCDTGEMFISRIEKFSKLEEGDLSYHVILSIPIPTDSPPKIEGQTSVSYGVPVMERYGKPYIRGEISEKLFKVACPNK